MLPSSSRGSGKTPRIPRSVRIEVETHTVRLAGSGLESIPCPGCRRVLAVHQPDPQWPDPLLGVCGGCGDWYLLWIKDDGKEAVAMPVKMVGLMRSWMDAQEA